MVALRADFYGRFAAYPGLAELLGANHVLVGPMQASELRRAVELPAGRVGLRVEPELADALVDDVEGEPGALPLLSTALLELWQKRQDNALTLAAYRESGGVHGAVARLAEGTYARIPDERKPLVRAVMLRLVGEGEGDAPVRRRAPLAELDLERNEDVADVLATLADSRLVTSARAPSRSPTRRCCANGHACASGSKRTPKGAGFAATSPRRRPNGTRPGATRASSTAAPALLPPSTGPPTTRSTSTSSSASSSPRAARPPSRRRSGPGARTGAFARCSPGSRSCSRRPSRAGSSRVVQRGEARDAETAQLAQRLGAQALVEEDLDLSLLLARQAVAIDDSPQTRGYLLAALRRSPAAIGIMHGRRRAAQGNRDQPRREDAGGRRLSTTGVLFFDARTYEQIGEPLPVTAASRALRTALTGEPSRSAATATSASSTRERVSSWRRRPSAERATRMAFTKDGSQLVVLVAPARRPRRSRRAITIRDAATLEPIGRSIEPEAFVGAYVGFYYASPHFALTADDRSLVTASEDGELAWWDLRSRRKTRTLPIETGLHALALSPDGRTAAVGIDRGIQLVDVRTGARADGSRALAGSPNWLLFSPDGETLVSTNLDGTVTLLGRRVGDAARDAARPLELRPAARLQPRRGDALHGEPRRHRDRLGPDGRSRARAAVHVHARPGRSPTGVRRPPGDVQPRRPADRGRPQGAGDRALGRARAHTGRGAPARNGRRGQDARLLTGRANARGRDRDGALTLWDVGVAIAAPWAAQRGRRLFWSASASARTGRRSPRRSDSA